jgi:tetratricopeptide (TPR) repeat protein
LIWATAIGALVSAAVGRPAYATGADMNNVPPVDTARCFGAISESDDEKIDSECRALIDNEKTAKADRIKALTARAGAFVRRDQIDRAIADYDMVLRLDPSLADIFNARGELWWKKGERPKALADFAAVIKLDPDHATARANYKSLAQELERLGALMAIAGKPSFNCPTARRPVEKAICANPELADLDRQITAVNSKVVRAAQSPHERQALKHEHDEFLARRNAEFGKPGYDLKQVMRDRLQHLLGADGN